MIRRLTASIRRAAKARTGALAFGAAVAVGAGLGALLGGLASRGVYRRAGERARVTSTAVRDDLDTALTGRHRALELLSRLPSVGKGGSEARQAFAAFRSAYPEFERVGLASKEAAIPMTRILGPRPLRITVGASGGETVSGTLRSGWPELLLGGRTRFGRARTSQTTILVGTRGSRTARTPEPADLKRLAALPDGGLATMLWSDGERYLTTIRRLAAPGSSRARLAVVSAYPLARLAGQARRTFAWGTVIGGLLGLIAGGMAWIGVARSTHRLRALNDVLERRVAERTAELAAAECSFRGIFENVPLGLYHCDRNGQFLRVNEMLARTLGYATPEALVASLGSLRAIGGMEARARFIERLEEEGEVRDATLVADTADGRTIWLSERARVVYDEMGKVLFIEGAVHDVTAQHELETQLRRIGETDALTGLLNRRGLTDAIAAAQAPVSIVTLDVDRFKAYNDTHGHPAGDRALQAVAAAIRGKVRASDAVARAGGEEFVVVLPGTGAAGARRVADALREAVAACEGLEEGLTVSGGVATALSAEEVGDAFVAADRALYIAKEAGRNLIVVNGAKLA